MAKMKMERGSGNVFADLGCCKNSDDMLTKAHLTHQIFKTIKERDPSQKT